MTDKAKIRSWLEKGKAQNATHVVILVDKWEWIDFYLICTTGRPQEAALGIIRKDPRSFALMECYDLSKDWDAQLDAHRVFNW